MGRRWTIAVMVWGALASWAGPASAWPAIQGTDGLHLCDTRPQEVDAGRWSCRSGGLAYEGALVDVTGGPYGPGPGYRSWPRGPAPRPAPYWGPWGWGPGGRPRGPESGYDELDPWLHPPPAPVPDR